MEKFFLLLIIVFYVNSQDIRPIRDDIAYCWNYSSMQKIINYLYQIDSAYVEPGFVAAISPHDDYLYAADVYYPLLKNIKVDEVIIFGVTHSTVRKEFDVPDGKIILDDYKDWTGIINNVPISQLREFIKEKLDTTCFIISKEAHNIEHSIESQIPFLQYFNPDIKITPIMVTKMDYQTMINLTNKLGEIIAEYIKLNNLKLGKNLLLIFSSDANHYGSDFNNSPYGEDEISHSMAIDEDLRIIQKYLEGKLEKEKIYSFMNEMKNVVWCGKYSIPFGLLTLQKIQENIAKCNIYGKLVKYSDTYSNGTLPLTKLGLGTTAPFSLRHWVGFFSLVFYIK